MAVNEEVLTFYEDDVPNAFKRRHRNALQEGQPGFGFWIWEPQVILMALNASRENQVVHYVGAGFHFRRPSLTRLMRYRILANSSPAGIVGFVAVPPFSGPIVWAGREHPEWSNHAFTKLSALKRLGLKSDDSLLDDMQFEAS